MNRLPWTAITSDKNPRLKQLAKLRTRRGRKQSGRTLVYGRREIRRAAESDYPLEQLWIAEEHAERFEREWLEERRACGTQLFTLPRRLLEPLSFGDRDDGCVAVVAVHTRSLDRLPLPPNPCVAIVEQLEKPGNLGAILRSADGAGISAVIVADPVTDIMNPNVIRASMGTVFTVPHCTATREEIAPWIRQHSLQIVATRVDAAKLYYEADLTGPTAIILGSEACGLEGDWRELGEQSVRLPMFGVSDSLNVSATAAVMFYEVFRQRRTTRTRSG